MFWREDDTEQAHHDLEELAEVAISADRIRRATEKIGNERAQQRDAEVQEWQQLSLPEQQQKPTSLAHDEVPQVACVQMDGGRLQIRDEQSPDDGNGESEASTKDDSANKTSWREDKVGICLSMTSEVSDIDPHPEIPSTFVDPVRMNQLAKEIKNAGKKPNKTGRKQVKKAQAPRHPFSLCEAMASIRFPASW